MRKVLTIVLLSVCFVLLSECNSPEKSKQTSFFSWSDAYDREVILDQEPQRIVSLSPAITEIVCMVGAEEKLVGISDFCNYPESVSKIPKVGGMQNINMEALLALNPDVVLIGSIVSRKDVETIEKLHIPVIVVKEEGSIAGMADIIEVIGQITNCEEKAKSEAENWRLKVSQLKKMQPQSTDRKRVYYVVGFGDTGDFTAPKTSHIHEIIELAGCENVGAELSSWNVSREFLFKSDPDIILVRSEDKDAFCSLYPYTLLKAVKTGKVFPIESGWIDVVSVRNIQAVEYLHQMAKK